ncbi:MAG: cysteine--tRNA ligase [Bacillota bacterium]
MEIFNTLTRKREKFVPINEDTVNIYVCGPTVYNYIHIGNARPVIFFDVVRRYFTQLGFTVNYVSNFTDVDDKIITKAIEDEMDELEVAEKFIKAFKEDAERLGSSTQYLAPRVTEYMSSIISYIERLVENGYAYEVNGNVYFRVSKAEDYGILSGRRTEELKEGARVDVNKEKEHPLDFTLWKKTDVGIKYPSPWGEGRPGWHTECVAMIHDIFGGKIDIHGGGSGLMFPHHENEIAQEHALSHHHIANYWMHNGLLNIDEKKMSKSEGRVILVKDLDYDYMGFRLFTLSTHYRSPINYTDDALKTNVAEWEKIKRVYSQTFYQLDLAHYLNRNNVAFNRELSTIERKFMQAMDDDFNTPNAITSLQSLVKYTNQLLRRDDTYDELRAALELFDTFLYILGLDPDVRRLSDTERAMYAAWTEARREKDFDKADQLREKLYEKGILG